MSLHKKKLPTASYALFTLLMAFTFSHAQVSDTIRVNCGGPAYTDVTGGVWGADTGSSGGTDYSTTDAISGTNDQTLFQTEEYGDTQTAPFYYSFNVPNGSYTVKLFFAEIYTGWCSAGSRVFNVDINGTTVLQNFDIYATAGCETALIEQFPVTTTTGNIKVNFTDVNALHPKINAIEIYPASTTSILKTPSGNQSELSVSSSNGGISVQTQTQSAYTLELSNLQGQRIDQKHGFGVGLQSFTNLKQGLYFVTLHMGHQNVTRMVSVVR
jgi:hypothetical protein